MWICEKGHKNSNSSVQCHGMGCKEYRPAEVQMKLENQRRKMNKQKDIMGNKIMGERMGASFMKMFRGMK